MKEGKICPACESEHLTDIYRLEAIPVQSCVLLDTPEEAHAFAHAPLLLKACEACGFVFNALFDAALLDYSSATEESQHFSGTFNRFAEELIAEIALRYDLEDRQTLEIGCGKGDFLKALVRATGSRGLGVDPGFRPERNQGLAETNATFRREYFDPASIEMTPDFIVCRHTLEHVPDVLRFVSDIARIVDGRSDLGIFFETPDVERVLAEGAFWDIYYEHCSYFTMGSHARLFRRAGLNVTEIRLAYEGQYIIQHAGWGPGTPLPEEDDLSRVRALLQSFPERVSERRAHWADVVKRRKAAGRRIAMWGGGSKAVAFLTDNTIANGVDQVVDINPYKQGRFLPGSGHRVIAPSALSHDPPDTVIAMNPIYLNEIAGALADLNIEAELMAV